MCNLAVANLSVEVLEQMILDRKIFTAFDVTEAIRTAVKENQMNESILHRDTRNIVNNEFITQQMAGYDRELCTLNVPGSPQALVYFPDTKQASDHPKVSGGSITSPAPAVSIGDASGVDLGDDEYKTTKEGRVQIPRKLVLQVTPSAGSYDIIIDGSTTIYRNVDARGDIRVGLKQYGIKDDKVRIKVDTSNNTINIETV